jgi:hypothetical protein
MQRPHRLYRNALRAYKETDLSIAGRALTKHPEVIGLTKATLRLSLRRDEAVNQAAHDALKRIMRRSEPRRVVLPRYGAVIQVQEPGGFGARFLEESGEFIGFVNP